MADLKKAVFMDRDGTINEEVGYLSRPDQLKLYPRSAEAIRLINESGMLAIVITNQSGVGRGYFSEDRVAQIHERLNEMLRDEKAHIDAFYSCFHHPVYGVGDYKKTCSCRKPEPGMIRQAASEFNVDLERSFMIGDMLKDVDAGRHAGAKGILVRTGYGENITATDKPVYIADDLYDAVMWILKNR